MGGLIELRRTVWPKLGENPGAGCLTGLGGKLDELVPRFLSMYSVCTPYIRWSTGVRCEVELE